MSEETLFGLYLGLVAGVLMLTAFLWALGYLEF